MAMRKNDKQWNAMYEKAQEYYEKHGNLLVPISYVCKDGTKLGVWINTQRAVKNGIRTGIIDDERKAKLDALGIDWDPNATAWNNGYAALKQYYSENGNIFVPLRYVTSNGFKLGLWLQNQRRAYLKRGRGSLSEEQIARLEDLSIIWDPVEDQWMQNYSIVKKYFIIHGDINVPNGYKVNGYDIYRWLGTQKANYEGKGVLLSDEHFRLLDDLGMDWGNKLETRWDKMYTCAEMYFHKYGHLQMTDDYCTDEGLRLGQWIATQRKGWRDHTLDRRRKERLDKIGMVWRVNNKQQTSFAEQAIHYYLARNYKNVLSRDRSTGVEFDIWIPEERVAIEYDGQAFHTLKKLKSDQKKNDFCSENGIRLIRLREPECPKMSDDRDNIYLSENTTSGLEDAIVQLFKKLKITDGNIDINKDCGEIYKQYLLIGPPVSAQDKANYIIDSTWMKYYKLAQKYYSEKGDLLIEQGAMYDGIALGLWVSNQRHYHNSNEYAYASQKTALLEKIGMVWNVNEALWERGFNYAKQYFEKYGNLDVPKKCIFDEFNLGSWVANQRTKYKGKYKSAGKLTALQVSRLEAIGMVWESPRRGVGQKKT